MMDCFRTYRYRYLSDKSESAFEEGFDAHQDAVLESKNPYALHSDENLAWSEGYDASRDGEYDDDDWDYDDYDDAWDYDD